MPSATRQPPNIMGSRVEKVRVEKHSCLNQLSLEYLNFAYFQITCDHVDTKLGLLPQAIEIAHARGTLKPGFICFTVTPFLLEG